MKTFYVAILLLTLAILPRRSRAQDEFTISGTMHHSTLEGGCWYLQTKDTKYELTGTPEMLQTCQIDGRYLLLSVRKKPHSASICMIGKTLEVVSIFDTALHPHDPPVSHQLIKGVIHKTKAGCWYVLATDKQRYELQNPVPKKFMRIGAKYNRMSFVEPRTESSCNMDGVITISSLEPDMKAKEKMGSDPR